MWCGPEGVFAFVIGSIINITIFLCASFWVVFWCFVLFYFGFAYKKSIHNVTTHGKTPAQQGRRSPFWEGGYPRCPRLPVWPSLPLCYLLSLITPAHALLFIPGLSVSLLSCLLSVMFTSQGSETFWRPYGWWVHQQHASVNSMRMWRMRTRG